MVKLVLFYLTIVTLVSDISLLENGLARTPPMGWMSWGYYMCADDCDKHPDKCLNEELIMAVADAFYKEGYQEAGYEYVIIDDCWSEHARDWDGRLEPNQKRFPRGMKFLADYIHSKGLKFGMYMNIAEDTCMRYPGSRGYFDIDAHTLASWDVDYIKVDGCFVEESYLDKAYIKLGHYLNMTGRPMVYSCSWPYYKKYIHKNPLNYDRVLPVCNLWRNFHDVAPNWGNVHYIIKHYEQFARQYSKYHGPGHWNDPDMFSIDLYGYRQPIWGLANDMFSFFLHDHHKAILILGTNSTTAGQSRIQMVVWAMLSAPLLISCDMTKVKADEKRLLINLDLLAVAQDALGIMALPVQLAKDVTLWVKPHLPMKGDMFYSYSFAVVNLGDDSAAINFRPGKYGLNSTDPYVVLDVLSGTLVKNITIKDHIEAILPGQDVLMYSLFPL